LKCYHHIINNLTNNQVTKRDGVPFHRDSIPVPISFRYLQNKSAKPMRKLLSILSILLLMACATQQPKLPSDHFIPGLASPLRLTGEISEIWLSDYIPDLNLVDSIIIDNEVITPSSGEEMFIFQTPPDARPMFEMLVWSGGNYQSVPVMKSRKEEHVYTFDPEGQVFQSVQLAGEFNGWTPSRTNLELIDGLWTVTLPLNPGRYQYQLVTDEGWSPDPGNPDLIDNNVGGFNSVMKAGETDKTKMPFLYTDTYDHAGRKIMIGWTTEPDEFFVLWQNIRLEEPFLSIKKGRLEISIPKEAAGFERSYIRIYTYNEYGIGNEILVPLEKGRVVTEAEQLNRADLHAQIIYNVFVDRFFNGNPENDRPIGDPSLVLPSADYHGGDIAGVTQKIRGGYFTGLGVNTIWISPIVLNPDGAYGLWKNPLTRFSAYHGYWPISFTEIDPRMGTAEELKELVREAHAHGINMLLDFVAHHVHELHPYYIDNPTWTTSLYLPDGTLNTEKWDEHRLTTWFDVFLPTLDLQQPEVTEMLSDSAVWWITEYGLDGFRHDATKHVPEIFWRTLTRKMKQQVVQAEKRHIYQIGETYGGPKLIASYVGSGMLDGQFDFNVYDAALGVFAREADPFTHLDNTLQTSFDFYGNHNLMGYITGNQDRGRFISYAGGDLKFDEDAKEAGWTRYIGVGDTVGYRRLSMLTAFNMTIPGLPVIYYGDEFGLPGGNDPDCRRMMQFDDLDEHELKTRETASKLANLRKNNPALIYGNFQTLEVSEKTYVFARRYFDDAAIVAFNKSDQAMEIKVKLPSWVGKQSLHSNFGQEFFIEVNDLKIVLAPWSFEILFSNGH